MFFRRKAELKHLSNVSLVLLFSYLVPLQNRNGQGQGILGENQDDIDGGKYEWLHVSLF